MKIFLLINIFLISSCISTKKQQQTELQEKTVNTPVRKVAAFSGNKTIPQWKKWLDETCASNRTDAAFILEALHPVKDDNANRAQDEANHWLVSLTYNKIEKAKPYFHTHIAKIKVQKCPEGVMTSSKGELMDWLEEVKVCTLSDAKKLITTFEVFGKGENYYKLKGSSDLSFHYFSKSGHIVKIGRRLCRKAYDSTTPIQYPHPADHP